MGFGTIWYNCGCPLKLLLDVSVGCQNPPEVLPDVTFLELLLVGPKSLFLMKSNCGVLFDTAAEWSATFVELDIVARCRLCHSHYQTALLHPCNSIPTILIQSITLLTVCRYSNLHPHISTAKLYPITTMRFYYLFHPCNSVSYYPDSKFHAITRLQILNLYPIIPTAKT